MILAAQTDLTLVVRRLRLVLIQLAAVVHVFTVSSETVCLSC